MEQGTDEWFLARAGKVTASKIADTMMEPSAAGYQNYMAQLVCERLTGKATDGFTSAAMQHGTDTEPQARAQYVMATHKLVKEVGFIPHPTLEMSGASPDGEVGTDGLVEIKCPQPAEHIRVIMGGAIKRNYDLQMQWQMECTGRDWCDFVSFNDSLPLEMQLHIQRVERNAEKIEEIKAAVTAFLAAVDAKTNELKKIYKEAE